MSWILFCSSVHRLDLVFHAGRLCYHTRTFRSSSSSSLFFFFRSFVGAIMPNAADISAAPTSAHRGEAELQRLKFQLNGAPNLHLVLLRGPPQCQRRLPLYIPPGDRLVIGRRVDCDVVLDPWLLYASGRHAAVECRAARTRAGPGAAPGETFEFWLSDLGSSNGTFLNKRRVTAAAGPRQVCHGDTVIFGGMQDVDGELDSEALRRPELVVWRAETPAAAAAERRLFAALDAEKEADDGLHDDNGEDMLYEATSLSMLPPEEDLDLYARYVLEAALRRTTSNHQPAQEKVPTPEPPGDPPHAGATPAEANRRDVQERRVSPPPESTPAAPAAAADSAEHSANRPTLLLSTAPTEAPEDPFLRPDAESGPGVAPPSATPTPVPTPAAGHDVAGGTTAALRSVSAPERCLDMEFSVSPAPELADSGAGLHEDYTDDDEPVSGGEGDGDGAVFGPITSLPALFPPCSGAEGEKLCTARRRRLQVHAGATSLATAVPPLRFIHVRLGAWQWAVPSRSQQPNTEAESAGGRAKVGRKRSRTAEVAAPATAELSLGPIHWVWHMPAGDAPRSSTSLVRCVLPVASIITVLVCPAVCGLAVELGPEVKLLPCPVPPAVLAGPKTNRWIVWAMRDDAAMAVAAPPSRRTRGDPVGTPRQDTALLFGSWVSCLFHHLGPAGLPEPHCVDPSTFHLILSPPSGSPSSAETLSTYASLFSVRRVSSTTENKTRRGRSSTSKRSWAGPEEPLRLPHSTLNRKQTAMTTINTKKNMQRHRVQFYFLLVPHSTKPAIRNNSRTMAAAPNDATTQLAALLRNEATPPDDARVAELVRRGADFFWQGPTMAQPILHQFVKRGWVPCATACIENAPGPIDFAVTNEHHLTVAHLLCFCCSPGDADPSLFLDASRETGALMLLGLSSNWRPEPSEVQRLLEAGAEPMFTDSHGSDYFASGFPEMNGSILHNFVRRGNVECVSLCLELSTRPIDFTQTDSWDRTLPQCLFGIFPALMPWRVEAMLKAMLERMKADGTAGRVQWERLDDIQEDFFSAAADAQLLSTVVPLVRGLAVPYLERLDPPRVPIQLTCQPWQWDWDLLSPEDQELFRIKAQTDVRRGVDRPTAELSRLCLMDEPDVEVVERCVAAGGNVNASTSSCDPILNRFLYGPSVASVAACLRTPAAIDFTSVGSDGWTALHFLCYNEHGESTVVAMLKHILDRLRTHPGDTIDWGHSDNRGYSIVMCVTLRGWLGAFWPLLRDVDYFQERRAAGPIKPPCDVPPRCWERLTAAGLDADFAKSAEEGEDFVSSQLRVFFLPCVLPADNRRRGAAIRPRPPHSPPDGKGANRLCVAQIFEVPYSPTRPASTYYTATQLTSFYGTSILAFSTQRCRKNSPLLFFFFGIKKINGYCHAAHPPYWNDSQVGLSGWVNPQLVLGAGFKPVGGLYSQPFDSAFAAFLFFFFLSYFPAITHEMIHNSSFCFFRFVVRIPHGSPIALTASPASLAQRPRSTLVGGAIPRLTQTFSSYPHPYNVDVDYPGLFLFEGIQTADTESSSSRTLGAMTPLTQRRNCVAQQVATALSSSASQATPTPVHTPSAQIRTPLRCIAHPNKDATPAQKSPLHRPGSGTQRTASSPRAATQTALEQQLQPERSAAVASYDPFLVDADGDGNPTPSQRHEQQVLLEKEVQRPKEVRCSQQASAAQIDSAASASRSRSISWHARLEERITARQQQQQQRSTSAELRRQRAASPPVLHSSEEPPVLRAGHKRHLPYTDAGVLQHQQPLEAPALRHYHCGTSSSSSEGREPPSAAAAAAGSRPPRGRDGLHGEGDVEAGRGPNRRGSQSRWLCRAPYAPRRRLEYELSSYSGDDASEKERSAEACRSLRSPKVQPPPTPVSRPKALDVAEVHRPLQGVFAGLAAVPVPAELFTPADRERQREHGDEARARERRRSSAERELPARLAVPAKNFCFQPQWHLIGSVRSSMLGPLRLSLGEGGAATTGRLRWTLTSTHEPLLLSLEHLAEVFTNAVVLSDMAAAHPSDPPPVQGDWYQDKYVAITLRFHRGVRPQQVTFGFTKAAEARQLRSLALQERGDSPLDLHSLDVLQNATMTENISFYKKIKQTNKQTGSALLFCVWNLLENFVFMLSVFMARCRKKRREGFACRFLTSWLTQTPALCTPRDIYRSAAESFIRICLIRSPSPSFQNLDLT
eukprot:gene1139-669_t